MNNSSRRRILPLAITGIVSGALGTIPLSRLPRVIRIGYVVVPGVVTAGATYFAVRSANGGGPRRRQGAAAGWAIVLGGVSAGVGAAGVRIDRTIEDALRTRNVPAPGLVMGVATGAVMTTLTALDLDRHHHHAGSTSTAELTGRVLDVLTALDPYDLEPGAGRGAPADEYSCEAASITELLENGDAVTAEQLDAIWKHWFSEPLSPLLEAQATAQLVSDLNALGSARSAR